MKIPHDYRTKLVIGRTEFRCFECMPLSLNSAIRRFGLTTNMPGNCDNIRTSPLARRRCKLFLSDGKTNVDFLGCVVKKHRLRAEYLGHKNKHFDVHIEICGTIKWNLSK